MDGTRTLLVVGTASHVGKSTVVAGLCRLLARRGVDVAPFKAQNMSNNAQVALRPDGRWGEIGVSQYVQARAARAPATTDLNPVLLKPRGGGESQLVIDGEAVGTVAAGEYYATGWHRAREAAEAAHRRLAVDYAVIVAEGAGGAAEINLRHRDLANRETARFADTDVLLLADTERGGAFASLYGTLELMPDDLRDRVKGTALTKFRGDEALLDSGIKEVEARTDVPVLGVIPYDDPGLPAEDSLSLPPVGQPAVVGDDDGVPDDRTVTVGVPRFPQLSNAADLDPLAAEPGIRVTYLPLDDPLDGVDAVVLPGTKNTIDDLLALQEAGFHHAIAAFDGPVVGLCGGYQMLGERLRNAAIEGTGDVDVIEGFGLLPVETRFSADKRVIRTTRHLDGVGPLAGASGTVRGYEIHAGETRPTTTVTSPLGEGSACVGHVLGTYLHGLFENPPARRAFVRATFAAAGREPPESSTVRRSPYDRAADLVEASLDLGPIGL